MEIWHQSIAVQRESTFYFFDFSCAVISGLLRIIGESERLAAQHGVRDADGKCICSIAAKVCFESLGLSGQNSGQFPFRINDVRNFGIAS